MNYYNVKLRMADGTFWESFTDADDALQAIETARHEFGAATLGAIVRRAVLGEWDCSSFTLAGHVPHMEGN